MLCWNNVESAKNLFVGKLKKKTKINDFSITKINSCLYDKYTNNIAI